VNIKHRGSLSTDKRVNRARGIDRVTLTYDRDNMLCYFYLDGGSKLELHTHPESQIGFVVKGHIHFIKGDGEDLDLRAGDSYYFGPNDPHGSEILEDTELIECFSPSRDDYKS